MKPDYAHRDLPLTPAIAAGLILQLFNGQLVTRRTNIDTVVRTHRDRGGRDSRAKQIASVMHKALAVLRRTHVANHASYRHWRIGGAAVAGGAAATSALPLDASKSALIRGEGFVYLYYFEAYRKLARYTGSDHFPCKVGWSQANPIGRVLSQTHTALPENPRIALVYSCANASGVERAIKVHLAVRRRRVHNSPGTEWFYTSPAEIARIVRSFKLPKGRTRSGIAPAS